MEVIDIFYYVFIYQIFVLVFLIFFKSLKTYRKNKFLSRLFFYELSLILLSIGFNFFDAKILKLEFFILLILSSLFVITFFSKRIIKYFYKKVKDIFIESLELSLHDNYLEYEKVISAFFEEERDFFEEFIKEEFNSKLIKLNEKKEEVFEYTEDIKLFLEDVIELEDSEMLKFNAKSLLDKLDKEVF